MDEFTDTLYEVDMGQSDSKGAKKKTGDLKSKGVASSFGFRRRPASTSRVENSHKHHAYDDNGNDGESADDLYGEGGEAASGRCTPLARPRKQTVGAPTRTNRFGFRQPGGGGSGTHKSSRVGDVSQAAEEAFSHNYKQTTRNNNASDKTSTNRACASVPPPAAQVRCTTTSTVVGANGVPRALTKQTVLLTYHTQQVPSHVASQRPTLSFNPRSNSVGRAGNFSTQEQVAPGGKYAFHTDHPPRTQYPVLRQLDTTDKQMVNNSRKTSGSSDGSREGSATDSGVSTGGDCNGDSPRMRRRPRNLEMVMKGAHSFHLRELNVPDLDIMDEAVITESGMIPLPKIPIHYDEDIKEDRTYTVPEALIIRPKGRAPLAEDECSPVSTLERYRIKTKERPSRIKSWEEEKFVLDRAQPENLDKQNSFIRSPISECVTTVSSSKESTPSGKSDAATETWNNDAAGEAMATRSQDDFSAYSTSSVEEDLSRKELVVEPTPVPQKTIVIADKTIAPHPLLMKSLNNSHSEVIKSIMINSMSSSNYSGMSTSTTSSSEVQNNTLTQDNNFEMVALEASTQSLIDDETSPADSLISSSNSNSNNDLANIDRDIGSLSSSAYQTANTKTKSSEALHDQRDDEPIVDASQTHTPSHQIKRGSKSTSPPSPGSPTHASVSLSLSDGRDFFDDEIADQPVLISMQRKNAEGSPPSRGTGKESEDNKSLRKSCERIPTSPLAQKNRKGGGGTTAGAERTSSLDTLSSLASDDMMMTDDLALSVTSLHSVDDYIERLDSSFRGLNSLTEQQLQAELSSSKLCAVQQWNQLLQQNSALDRQLAAHHASLAASSISLTEIQASLPVRTARLLQRSRAQTPGCEPAPGPAETTPPTPATPAAPAASLLLQDVVDIKTLLLQLKRVLHESETLDPLLSACADPPARGNGRPLPSHDPDQSSDLRRQILYLQSQVEERDRLVRMLQQQMSKMADNNVTANNFLIEDMCNVATQTDRLRPPAASITSNTENSGLVRM